MKITKKSKSYDQYDLDCSHIELMAIKDALMSHHGNPVADALYQGILWSLEHVPGPGEEEEKDKPKEGVKDGELASSPVSKAPTAGGDDMDIDAELPAPPTGTSRPGQAQPPGGGRNQEFLPTGRTPAETPE